MSTESKKSSDAVFWPAVWPVLSNVLPALTAAPFTSEVMAFSRCNDRLATLMRVFTLVAVSA
jgi:hypothetical protein